MLHNEPRVWRAWRLPRLGIVVALLCLTSLSALAQSGGAYDLTWNTIDAGGATFSTGGIYSLGGTVGQPDTNIMSGGVFSLAGGFWPGGSGPSDAPLRLFLPLLVRRTRLEAVD